MRPSNSVVIIGRMTKDVDLRYSQSENSTAIARFTLAVDRGRKDADGNNMSDFPSCIAFGKTAEFIDKYFHKGSKIAVSGSLQTGKYQNQKGDTVYTTDVIVEQAEFVESKSSQNAQNGQNGGSNSQANNYPPKRENAPRNDSGAFKTDIGDGFVSLPEDVGDEGLPWN